MKTYICVGAVSGGKYLGEVKANSPEEALEKAFSELDVGVSLCHQCSGECENVEIQEIYVECDGEDVTPMNREQGETSELKAEIEKLNKTIEIMNSVIAGDGQRERKLRAEIQRLKSQYESRGEAKKEIEK